MAAVNGIHKPAAFKIGIIGGTGFEDPGGKNTTKKNIDTPYGKPSDALILGTVQGIECVFLSRHGRHHRISPTHINYRANIWALKKAGVAMIIAANACGSLREELAPGHMFFPDSFIDRTSKREQTFYDEHPGHPKGICHMPMHPAFGEKLRQLLIANATKLNIPHQPRGTIVCVEGLRFSTRAESEFFRKLGADVVGMTTHPEAILAKELGIPYATVAIVTHYDSWKDTDEGVSIDLVARTVHRNAQTLTRLLRKSVKAIGEAKEDFLEEAQKARKLAISSVMDGGLLTDSNNSSQEDEEEDDEEVPDKEFLKPELACEIYAALPAAHQRRLLTLCRDIFELGPSTDEWVRWKVFTWAGNKWNPNDRGIGIDLSPDGLSVSGSSFKIASLVRAVHAAFPPNIASNDPIQVCYFEVKFVYGFFAIGFCGSDVEVSGNPYSFARRMIGMECNDFNTMELIPGFWLPGIGLPLPGTGISSISNAEDVVGCGLLKHLGKRRIFFTRNGEFLASIPLPPNATDLLFPAIAIQNRQGEPRLTDTRLTDTNFGLKPFLFKYAGNEEKLLIGLGRDFEK